MTAYLIRRFFGGIITLLMITLIVYILIRNMPGDPVLQKIMGNVEGGKIKKDQTARQIELMRKNMGLDTGPIVGYFTWLKRVLRFDLGESLEDKRRITERIGERIIPTLWLSIPSLFLIYLLSIPLGLYVTAKNRSLSERFLSTTLYVLYSVPSFVMALFIMSYLMRLFPGVFKSFSGMHSDQYDTFSTIGKIWDRFKYLVLPIFCYTYGGLAYYTRFIRSNMMEVIRQDYIRTAKAKGLPDNVVLIRHGFRNSLIPLVTLLGMSLPSMLSGSIILENIFSWPGMGKEFLESITKRDYPMIMGITLMFSILIMIGNMLADILYAIVDPRVTYH